MGDSFTFPKDDTNQIRRQWKEGVRVLGVAESFEKSNRYSYLAGVIMRGDFKIDGFGFCNPLVGGMDSTEKLLEMYRSINRKDLHAWMLGGCIISWFNPVDIHRLSHESEIPVICVSYEPSLGLEQYVKEYFPDNWKSRMDMIKRIGDREKFKLDSGYEAFIVCRNIDIRSAKDLVNLFTCSGRVPEPIRVARTLAAETRKHFKV